VLVSHDRYFLDVTVRRILELWNKGLYFYSGGYSRYEEQKTERRAQLAAAFENQQDRIRQLEAFHHSLPLHRHQGKQVQSPHQGNRADGEDRNSARGEERPFPFSAAEGQRPRGGAVSEVAKSYGDLNVFADVDFYIERGDRVALVGVNGAGKSTLIKILAGVEPVTAGGTPWAQRRAGLLRTGPV